MTAPEKSSALPLSRRTLCDLTTLFDLAPDKRCTLELDTPEVTHAGGLPRTLGTSRARIIEHGRSSIARYVSAQALPEVLPQAVVGGQVITPAGLVPLGKYQSNFSVQESVSRHLWAQLGREEAYGESLRRAQASLRGGRGEFRSVRAPTATQMRKLCRLHDLSGKQPFFLHVWYGEERLPRFLLTQADRAQTAVPVSPRYYGGLSAQTVVVALEDGEYTLPAAQYREEETRWQPYLTRRLLREDHQRDLLTLIEALGAYSPGERAHRYFRMPLSSLR